MKNIEITEITIKMLFESGIIKPNTILYSDTHPVFMATINQEGLIVIKKEGKIKAFPYPSGAARAIVNLSVNGWKFWRIKLNDKLTVLSDLREIYRNQFT